MRTEAQTGAHLLMASIVSGYSVLLVLIIFIMSWELWMAPLVVIGCLVMWWLHIGRIGSETIYENMCAGLLLLELFFFGVHTETLFEIPLMCCVLILFFSLLDRKRLLYMAAAIYLFHQLYHFLILHTLSLRMSAWGMLRMVLGAGAVLGAVTLALYRIKRRQAEQKKYFSMKEQLGTAVRQNADFLSNVSHELRTPVNMVIGISEVTLGKEISPEIREDVRSIRLAGRRLSGQINNILDYTEIVEGTLAAVKEPYEITSVMNDVITMATLQNGGQKLELVFDMDPRIPSVLIGDAEKIAHVIRILLENSIKFTEEGGIDVKIGFRREEYGINLIVDICDTGIGMTPEQLERMFDDFYQADSGSARYVGGLGLGIPIAKGLLHAMGGFAHFESKEQQGLQVHIIIPQGVEDDTPSISIPGAPQLCIACFFKPERYVRDEVRQYYDDMILHMVEGLGIEGYQAHNFEGLLKLQRERKLTHVFIAQTEYMANPPYYEELAGTMPVAVIAERDFVLDEDSALLVLRKPFFALSVVNLLEGQGDGLETVQAAGGHKPFVCEGIKALAVDDEEMNLMVAKGFLGSYGIQVDTCLSGKEALEKCARTDYDVIFLDHMMPGFDGVETLRRIREIKNGIYKDLPIIALTANTISGAREMFRNEGFTEFVPKPIERSVLERVLRRVLPESCMRYETVQEDADSAAPSGMPTNETAARQPSDGAQDSAVDGEAGENAASDDGKEEPMLPYGSLVRAGINVAVGLDYCGGDEMFYREMLQMFHDMEAEKRQELNSLYEAGNWTDYAIKAHALKSTSLTIGAEALSGQAKGLELAGKKGDTAYIHENHPLMMQSYQDICASIEDLFSEV